MSATEPPRDLAELLAERERRRAERARAIGDAQRLLLCAARVSHALMAAAFVWIFAVVALLVVAAAGDLWPQPLAAALVATIAPPLWWLLAGMPGVFALARRYAAWRGLRDPGVEWPRSYGSFLRPSLAYPRLPRQAFADDPLARKTGLGRCR